MNFGLIHFGSKELGDSGDFLGDIGELIGDGGDLLGDDGYLLGDGGKNWWESVTDRSTYLRT